MIWNTTKTYNDINLRSKSYRSFWYIAKLFKLWTNVKKVNQKKSDGPTSNDLKSFLSMNLIKKYNSQRSRLVEKLCHICPEHASFNSIVLFFPPISIWYRIRFQADSSSQKKNISLHTSNSQKIEIDPVWRYSPLFSQHNILLKHLQKKKTYSHFHFGWNFVHRAFIKWNRKWFVPSEK